jgi:hypothetical protein
MLPFDALLENRRLLAPAKTTLRNTRGSKKEDRPRVGRGGEKEHLQCAWR